MVGAVVVCDGKVVGAAYHRRVGGPHAEVAALRQAGQRARGATLYVTLEPCAHHGRTPPCTEAVIAAGVGRVVACHRDPDPRVSGEGFARLEQAGIEVERDLLIDEAVYLNWRYLVATVLARPAVSLKWAMSLDGRTATATGESQWISSPAGRRWGLDQREEHDATLIGIGTALSDDPQLNRRLGRANRPNVRVVLDRRLRLPPTARLLDVAGEVLVYTESTPATAAETWQTLGNRGAQLISMPSVTPAAVLKDLYGRGVQSVLVEGGAQVASAFAEAGLFDRVAVDLAPLLIGGVDALGALGGNGFSPLADVPRLADLRVERRGGDVILKGFREQCLPDLYASVAG